MTAVAIRNLRVTAGGRELLALPELMVRAGEHVVVVGANGAGKSTLLRCLGGFVRPQADVLQVLGQPLAPQAPGRHALRALRREVGQVLQGLHLVARLSALDNTLIGALGRLRGAEAWRSCWRHYPPLEVQAALQALQAVGLAAQAHTRADRLSGGERQKVAMARVLLQRPRLVLADEPTASLDPAATQEAIALLRHVAADATLITIVHDPALVPMLGERVLGLRGGRLVLDGPVAALDVPAQARLYAGTA
jgi:phosphonate transport system ATP-binding protein